MFFPQIPFLGLYRLNDLATISVQSRHPDTGMPAEVDRPPTYKIYPSSSDQLVHVETMTRIARMGDIVEHEAQIFLATDHGFTTKTAYIVRIDMAVHGVRSTAMYAFTID